MGKYRFSWQAGIAAALLFLMMITVFFPGFSLDGDKYADAAVAANRRALETDENTPGAQEIIRDYTESGISRTDFRKNYEERSISRLFLAKWALRVKNRIDFDSVQFMEGKSLKDTEIRMPLRLWGWMIYIPFLMCMVTLVFVIAKGRPLSGVLLIDGAAAFVCECLSHFLIPGMLWNGSAGTVQSFELVSADVLAQSGTGKLFVKELLRRCGGVVWIFVIILALLLILYGVICMILWIRKGAKESEKGRRTLGQETETWKEINSERRRTVSRPVGQIQGIAGEYRNQTLDINSGEEIVLGRDPRFCMLIFSNPRVSRRQCGIRYDSGEGCYWVIDYSSGGTVLDDGRMLPASEYAKLPGGTLLIIADGAELLLLI